MRQVSPELDDDFSTVKFRSGRYENVWVKNVAAVGNDLLNGDSQFLGHVLTARVLSKQAPLRQ